MITYPKVLWLLLLLIPAGIILYGGYKNGKKSILLLGGKWRGEDNVTVYLVKWFFSSLFFLLALGTLIFALAGFTWGRETVKDERYGLDVTFVVDISRSMLARDISPDRLRSAASLIQTLTGDFPADRFSLSVFKGKGLLLIPATEDIGIIGEIVRNLSPDLLTLGGTNLEEGIREGLEAFPPGVETRQLIILFTDGESLSGAPASAARDAGRRGVPVFVVGCATGEGNPVPAGDSAYIREKGDLVISRLHEEELRMIAEESGGEYFHIANSRIAEELIQRGRDLNKRSAVSGLRVVRKPQYRFFLVWSLVFFGLYVGTRVFRWKGIL